MTLEQFGSQMTEILHNEKMPTLTCKKCGRLTWMYEGTYERAYRTFNAPCEGVGRRGCGGELVLSGSDVTEEMEL